MKDGTRIEITTGTIARAILLIVAAIMLFMLKDLVLVVLTAVVIASSMEPFIQWFMKRRIYRIFSALIVYMVLTGILVGSFYTFVPRLLQDSSEFLSLVPQYLESSSLWNPLDQDIAVEPRAAAMSISAVPVSSEVSSIKDALQGINEAISSVSVGFVHSASSIFGGLLSFILIAVLSFYLAVQEDGVEKFLRIVIPDKNENYVVNLWKRTQTKIGLWMQGQIILALLVGALVYLGLTLLGVKNALLFAVLAAILETIPLFGPILAAIPAVAVSYNDGGATASFLVAGLYLIIHQLENHIIYPLVVKKIVGISPILVILALLVGLKLAGFLGIILSVPIASLLVEFLDDVAKDKKAVKGV